MSDDTIDKSGYNEASFKMERLNESQRRISFVNQDLLKYYNDLAGYGYIVKKSELGNLLMEVYGKLDSKNKETSDSYISLLNNYLEYFPIRTISYSNGIEGNKKFNNINQTNYKKFEKLLTTIHTYVLVMLEKAGYSTFTVEEDNGDPYN